MREKSAAMPTPALTSVYSTALGISATLAAGVSVPVARLADVGWRGALALWALPAVIAAVAWLPQLRRSDHPANVSAPTSYSANNLWRSPLAWQVTLFMGLQSLAYYVTLTWLPQILREEGMSAARAGWMLALLHAVSIAAKFIAPVIAGRRGLLGSSLAPSCIDLPEVLPDVRRRFWRVGVPIGVVSAGWWVANRGNFVNPTKNVGFTIDVWGNGRLAFLVCVGRLCVRLT